MARDFSQANALQRGIRRLAGTGPGSWVFSRTLDHLDRWTYRATRGKHMLSSLVSALPVAMVTTTGARSGEPRTVPLLAMPTADGMAIIGSWYGNPKHPAWRHNLRKRPDGEIEVEGERWAFRAVEVEDERRERIWQQALLTHPGFSAYAKRAAPRRISVFVLEPKA
jgi:deazaflavin-dependent oxidoreductase (nitroreductase family)